MQPSEFITNTDYATLKNDDGDTASIDFTGRKILTGSGYYQSTATLVIGAKASINRIQISSSKDSDIRYSTFALEYQRTGTSDGVDASYNIIAYVSRTSATELQCAVYVQNPSSSSLTTAAEDETFNFYIDTFIPPFTS